LTAVLDSFVGSDPEPIDWHEGEDGDYIVRQEDVKRCGKGSHNLGFRLLSAEVSPTDTFTYAEFNKLQ
jgi:hypothetical protein